MAGFFLSFRFNSEDPSSTSWILEDTGNKVEMVSDLEQLTVLWVGHTSNYHGGKRGRKYPEWGRWAVRCGTSELQFSPRLANLGTTLRNTSLEVKGRHSVVKPSWVEFQLLARALPH